MRRVNRLPFRRTILAVLLGGAIGASIVGAQEPLQFNVPYHCPDGTDNVITKCETNARGGQICFWREEKNGQLIVERYNIRSQMDGWLKICKVQSTPATKPAAATSQPGQPMNPPYLAEMPSVDRVKQEIQGANPTDTFARQVAVFTYLPQIVQRRQDPNRSVRQPMTPDEQRVVAAYNLAAYELEQAFARSHTPDEVKLFDVTHGHYEMDPAFYDQWFNRLFSPAFRAGYEGVQATKNAQYQAHVDAERRDNGNRQAFGAPAAAPAPASASASAVKPGSQAELARCIASGRSQRICFSEVMGNGFDQLTGLGSLKPQIPPGLRMTGDYATPDGFRLIFQPDKVTIVCRGVPLPEPYLVEMTGTQAIVKIQHGPQPVVFSLRADGRLAGSGPIRVTGQVPAGTTTEQTSGMTTQTTTRQVELTPLEARNYPNAKQNGQVFTVAQDATELVYGPTGTRTVTNFVTKTADCNLGMLAPTGLTPLPPDIESPFGLLTTIFSGASVLMNGGSTKDALGEMLNLNDAPPPGLRMNGKYAGPSGFSVTFHHESATVACGDAELAHPYSVEKVADQILLKIPDTTNPIALQLKPDGSLVGGGAVQVNGRVIVGTTEDPKNPFVYKPNVGRCAVGSLVATTSGK